MHAHQYRKHYSVLVSVMVRAADFQARDLGSKVNFFQNQFIELIYLDETVVVLGMKFKVFGQVIDFASVGVTPPPS